MKQKLTYILEIIWLIIAIGSLVFAIFHTYSNDSMESVMLYIVAFLASLMYTSRRYLRKTQKKDGNNK